jgi:cell division protein ZapA
VKRTVTLEIAGARYRMASDADEDHLRKLADLVNERIAALGPKAQRSATPAQLLAVVALGLADELVQSENRRRELESSTLDALTRAIARIDRRLQVEAPSSDEG